MGRLFVQYLPDGRKYACKECLAGGSPGGSNVVHLASVSDLLSKSFHSRHGPAYLFNAAVNVTLGSPEERDMTTGKHVVRDLYCVACGTNLGWRYEMAHERREKYKEGKYILERLQMVDLEAAGPSSDAHLPAAATAAIAAASPGSSPGSNVPMHPPPRNLFTNAPVFRAASAGAGQPTGGAPAVMDPSDLPELRAFFATWAPTAPVTGPPPFNINLCTSENVELLMKY